MDIIRHILKKISEGKTTFKSASNSQSDMEDFQSVAKVFVHMNKQGWLDSFKESSRDKIPRANDRKALVAAAAREAS